MFLNQGSKMFLNQRSKMFLNPGSERFRNQKSKRFLNQGSKKWRVVLVYGARFYTYFIPFLHAINRLIEEYSLHRIEK